MNVTFLLDLYNVNKELDNKFIKEYGINDEIILKNKLEMLVELGELANESKCFKFWINKPVNRELVLFEYADLMLMILYFLNLFGISLDEKFPEENNLEVLNEFMYLYGMLVKFDREYTGDVIKDILVNFLRLGKLLGLSNEEIVTYCLKKININKERFNFSD